MRFGSHFVGSEDQTQAIRPKRKCLVRSPHLGDRDRRARFQGHLQLYTVQGQSKLHESLFQKNQSRLNSNMCQVVTILDLEIWGRKYSRQPPKPRAGAECREECHRSDSELFLLLTFLPVYFDPSWK